MYLAYDLKGIQSFIFAVPRLRHICGGSALIDRFDRDLVPRLDTPATKLLFSGGGKGSFYCESLAVANSLQEKLVRIAHDDGISISFGRHQNFSEASHVTDRNFPFLPKGDELSGQPCEESGLLPSHTGVHPMIAKRVWQRGDHLARRYESELLAGIEPPPGWSSDQCEFFHDVSSRDGDDDEAGKAGAGSLGGRNRWAVIAMDGNDIGNQHRTADGALDAKKMQTWIGRMSQDLDICTRAACRAAIQLVIRSWWGEGLDRERATTRDGITILPVRPLVVGGDDIIILCHVRHALQFVREACRVFAEHSAQAAAAARKEGLDLWPATGGRLSISAGILFAPVTLPLASAIPYAEALLKSAKSRGRNRPAGEPAPACLDWESVTEGLIDQPHTRRQRELRFFDADIQETVDLTRRPYTLDDFTEVEALASGLREVPPTIRHQVLTGLRAGYWDRQVFAARLGKHQEQLVAAMAEGDRRPEVGGGRWRRTASGPDRPLTRCTDLPDALLLLEEDARMASVRIP